MFCSTCGAKIESEKAIICPSCGCAVANRVPYAVEGHAKDQINDPHYAAYLPGSFRMIAQRIAYFCCLAVVLALWAGGTAAITMGGWGWMEGTSIGVLIPVLVIGIPMLLTAYIMTFVLLYRSWAIIQEGRARTTPGKAVGYCFIPVFNFIWVFVAVTGLVNDMKDYRQRFGLTHVSPPSLGWAIAVSIVGLFWPLVVAFGIPFILGTLLWIPFGFSLARCAEAIQAQRIQTGKVVIPQESLPKPLRFWNVWTILLTASVFILPAPAFLLGARMESDRNLSLALCRDNYTSAKIAWFFGGKPVGYFARESLFSAVEEDNIKRVEWILSYGVDVNVEEQDYRSNYKKVTPLDKAKSDEVRRLLIAAGGKAKE